MALERPWNVLEGEVPSLRAPDPCSPGGRLSAAPVLGQALGTKTKQAPGSALGDCGVWGVEPLVGSGGGPGQMAPSPLFSACLCGGWRESLGDRAVWKEAPARGPSPQPDSEAHRVLARKAPGLGHCLACGGQRGWGAAVAVAAGPQCCSGAHPSQRTRRGARLLAAVSMSCAWDASPNSCFHMDLT